MASNALSKRRGLLERPDVCHSHENPGRCQPPPPPVPDRCSLDPAAQTIEVSETAAVTIDCCKGALPYLDPFEIALDFDHPDWIVVGTEENCAEATIEFLPEEAGITSHVHVTITFSDDSTCELDAEVTVDEEEPP